MEPFTSSSTILVTGANGHVAQHVVSQLLSLPLAERPKVRATVRSEASSQGLRQTFPSQVASGHLEFAYIPDIASPGAFDEPSILESVTHIAHIASPLVIGVEDAERDLLRPAINGTTSLLASALKSSTLKSVVVTSSFAAVVDPMFALRPGYIYTSTDWNPITYEAAADKNLDLTPWPEQYQGFITYMASKKLAEKAAWEIYDKEKPSWRLSTVCPTYIGGPNVLPLAKGVPDGLSLSQKLIWNVANSKPDDKLPEIDFPGWVDVRDVAKSIILALQARGSQGQRFLLAPNLVSYSDIADVVRSKMGRDVSAQKQVLNCYQVEMQNCENVLGIKKEDWVPFEKMVVDTAQQV